ncbi:hypothetical protein [Streptomyces sp. NPDC059786]|uniref:hypothetical protein n=1 Tax=Streptomyces sp. NPDC059786 TaxID=3346946 RepID=UPI003646EC35
MKPQPFERPTLDLVTTALAALDALKQYVPTGALDGAVGELRAIETGAEAGIRDPEDCEKSAALLAVHVADVHAVVERGFVAAWSGASTQDARERLALEVAALCVMEGRWHARLSDDIRSELSSRRPLDAGRLLRVLLPPEQDFRVAVVVEGTSRLDSVDGLMDPAAAAVAISPGEPIVGWGHATADLQALADLAAAASSVRRGWSRDQADGHLLLTFTVRARDLGGAASLGRRIASESLDRYVAGQRLAEIRLRSETLAHAPGSRRVLRLVVPALGSGPVRPLTTGWPLALRESLRTAHIARITEAPTTAAGLCWAALEALDVKARDQRISALARALALQALRQQAVDLHQRTRRAVAAEVAVARAAQRGAQEETDRLNAAAARAAGSAHAAALAEKAATARATALDRHAELERALETRGFRVAVDAWTGVGEDGFLRDVDRWLDVFAPPAQADPVLRDAADGFTALTDRLGGETADRLGTWRTRMADPRLLARWIEETAGRFETCLDWLYALRNTALHDGRFDSATDLLDVHTGRSLVDLTLEFLGNWYQHAATPTPEQPGMTAFEVIRHLADRQQSVVAALRGGTRAKLNVTRLTSPASDGWDRA